MKLSWGDRLEVLADRADVPVGDELGPRLEHRQASRTKVPSERRMRSAQLVAGGDEDGPRPASLLLVAVLWGRAVGVAALDDLELLV